MNIKFSFKGDRDYVHGSDFFDVVSDHLDKEEYILGLMLRRFSKRQCQLVAKKTEAFFAEVITNKRKLYAVETEEEVVSRYTYDESIVSDKCVYLDERVSMDSSFVEFSSIEKVILLTKNLNNHVDKPFNGKWYFTQLKLSQSLPKSIEVLAIQTIKRVKGRFSQSNIYVDEVNIGSINFIVGNE